MKASPAFLQKIRDSVNLIDIVAEHVVLRKTGANAVGLCPFHSERSPSFSVSEEKQLYHCYGCKKGGDLFSFVMEMHGLSFSETVEELAGRANLQLPQDWKAGSGSGVQRQKQETAFKLNRFAAAFFHRQLSSVAPFLKSRGVSELEQLNFYLGLANPSWDSLARYLTQTQSPLPLAQELGLIRPSTQNVGGFFDLFRNRAIFPILDLRGKVAGFGGRLLPTGAEAAKDGTPEGPKYLNSQESFIFHKSKNLFGLFQAQKFIREADEVILVEGYFDVLVLHSFGFQNVVATCGTALTPEHLQLLGRLAQKITVLFDGDEAGIAATERAMELGLSHGKILAGASLPNGLDPDELILQHGKEKLTELLSKAQPLLDNRIEKAIQEAAQGPEARANSLKKISNWLGRFTDPVGREVRWQYVQQKLGMNARVLQSAKAHYEKAQQPRGGAPIEFQPIRPRPAGPAPVAKIPPVSDSDRTLLQALLRGGPGMKILASTSDKLPPEVPFSDIFDHSLIRQWAKRLMTEPGLLNQVRSTPDQILGDLDPQIRSIFIESLLENEKNGNAGEGEVELERIRSALGSAIKHSWAQFSQRMRQAMVTAEASQDLDLQAKLMKDYLDVQRKIKEFSQFI